MKGAKTGTKLSHVTKEYSCHLLWFHLFPPFGSNSAPSNSSSSTRCIFVNNSISVDRQPIYDFWPQMVAQVVCFWLSLALVRRHPLTVTARAATLPVLRITLLLINLLLPSWQAFGVFFLSFPNPQHIFLSDLLCLPEDILSFTKEKKIINHYNENPSP